jgi:hypothetical protein
VQHRGEPCRFVLLPQHDLQHVEGCRAGPRGSFCPLWTRAAKAMVCSRLGLRAPSTELRFYRSCTMYRAWPRYCRSRIQLTRSTDLKPNSGKQYLSLPNCGDAWAVPQSFQSLRMARPLAI